MDRRQAVTLLALACIAGCTSGPRALRPGQDACEYCRMTIDDLRFGAMVLTARGRIHTFDSIECLSAYVAALPVGEPPRGVYVANHDQPAQWVDATQAIYVKSSRLHSPMGRQLAAFAREADRTALVAKYGGTALSWKEVMALVAAIRPVSTRTPMRGASGAGHARAH